MDIELSYVREFALIYFPTLAAAPRITFSSLLIGSLLTNYYCQPLLQELYTLHYNSLSTSSLVIHSRVCGLRARQGQAHAQVCV